MTDTFHIVLEDVNQYDTYGSREFDLLLNSTFPIGRASRNATKRELMPAPHNAYIDSPVISREHAVLSASASSGAPHVFITDQGSMHGTMVNGHRLAPNTPQKLSAGDVLQFGVDVNRNEEYFVARKYTFNFRLSRPFSLGFTVPDAESEEEEVDAQERRGSQIHPLMIDDSESASEQSDDDQADMTMVVIEDEETVAPTETQSVDADKASDSGMPTMLQTMINEESYSEEEEALMAYSSQGEDEETNEVDIDSDVASVGTSEPEYNSSEREVPDSEEEEPVDATPYKQPSMTNPWSIQTRDLFDMDEVKGSQAPELPSLDMFSQSYDIKPFADGMGHSLPPRPSAAKPAPWNNNGFTPFAQQSDNQSWYSDEMAATPSYLGTNFGDRPSLFSPPPAPPAPESLDTMAGASLFSAGSSSMKSAEHMQTPPPMPTSDVTTSPPMQPNRRTKVSIEEIVEEQPLTPNSVNDMKRKADVLEEEEIPLVMEPVTALEAAVDASSRNAVTDSAAQTAAIIAQRPKKQPRSILGKVLNKAAYPLLGAAGAVASFTLLSTLPDAFFGA